MLHDKIQTNGPAENYIVATARQEIEYLRRLYGKATDLLGLIGDAGAKQQATEIYHQIFNPGVQIRVTGGAEPLIGGSPTDWIEVVSKALGPYESTQHLIGTQVVTFEAIEFNNTPVSISSGRASMTSYLQAWHVWPDRRLRVVMGTYVDEVEFNPKVGWQITDMNLVYTATEHRMLDQPT